MPRVYKKKKVGGESENFRKIDEQLEKLYKDDNGKIPDMKKVRIKKHSSFISRLFGFVLVIGIISGVAWLGIFYLPNLNKVTDDQVELSIEGPQTVEFGATTTYNITFKNKQRIALNKVNLILNYPEGFVFTESSAPPTNNGKNEWQLPDLNAFETREIVITGKMFSTLQNEQSIRVNVDYTPQNMQTAIQKTVKLILKTDRTPFLFTVQGPDKNIVGKDVTYTINISKTGDWWPDKFIITPVLPTNFQITSSSVVSSTLVKDNKNNFILVPNKNNTSTTSYTINLTGRFSDSEDLSPVVKFQLSAPNPSTQENAQIAESSVTTNLIKNAITLTVALNGANGDIAIKPSDTLNYTLSLKNNGKENITNAQIKINFTTPSNKKQSALLWSEITDKNDGDIKGDQISDTVRTASITWNSKKIKDLAQVNQTREVLIDFQLPVKDAQKFAWSDIKDPKITFNVEVTYTDIAGVKQSIVTVPTTITVNSDLSLDTKDAVSGNKHDISWVLNNSVHPLKNLILSADIYGDAIVTLPPSAPAGTLDFNSSTKRLVWSIADMNENMDVLALPFSVTINKNDPTQNVLVAKPHLQALDTVTNQTIELFGEEIKLGE